MKRMKLILERIFYMPKPLFRCWKNIPLRILNTFNHENKGTLITSNSVWELKRFLFLKMLLWKLEGRGLLGKQVDARIFRVMGDNDISVSISARFVRKRNWVVVAADKASKAMIELEKN
jgi:aspartokinase/homoserine dehydrogenase 1